MRASVFLPIWALFAFGVYKIISIFVEKRRRAAKAKKLGCKEAPMYPRNGFYGLKSTKELLDADNAQLFPDHLIQRYETVSKHVGHQVDTYKFVILGQALYSTCDPRNIQAILATQFDDFYIGPARRNNMIATVGDGIFVQDGKAWEHSRAMLRPNFVRDKISDLDREERHVEHLMKALPVQPNNGGWTAETDIQTLFFRFTLDSATEFLIGESVDSQLAYLPDVALNGKSGDQRTDVMTLSANFESAESHVARRFRLANMYWLHNPKEFRDNNKIVKDFIDNYVDLALRARRGEKNLDAGHKKEKYVLLTALAEQTQDPAELRGQLLNVLMAGRDTTASLLSWLFNQLLRNPAVFEQLRATIVNEFGTHDNPRNLEFSTLKGCKYLQYCLNETLRLWTVVPNNLRLTYRDTTLPRGGGPDGQSPVFIPKGTDVHFHIHATHRRKDIWGEDADEFRPERFEGRLSGWDYLPFSGGPRICIGQELALTEAAYVTVRLLQRFDKIEPGAHELEGRILSNLKMTSCPGRKVTLRLHEAT